MEAAHRHEQHSEHGHSAERGADAHRHQQADERNDNRDNLAPCGGGKYRRLTRQLPPVALMTESVAACHQHNDGNLAAQTDTTLDLLINVTPFDSAERIDDQATLPSRRKRQID